MSTRQKIAELEPWDQRLALAMVEERDQWLDSAMDVCIRSSRTRDDAVAWLAEAMEEYLQKAVEKLSESTPAHIALAMEGFWQLEPNLCFECITDALIEDAWPEGSPKPAVQAISKNRRSAAGRTGTSSSKNRKSPSKRKPAGATPRRHRP